MTEIEPESLVKAKGALVAAGEVLALAEPDQTGAMRLKDIEELSRKLQVAQAQASIAQAEILLRIAQSLTLLTTGRER